MVLNDSHLGASIKARHQGKKVALALKKSGPVFCNLADIQMRQCQL